MGKPLLIISCSSKKKSLSNERLPAFDLYDGVFYRLIKKAIKEKTNLFNSLNILILSAKYGLITTDQLIETYDLKMSNKIALQTLEINTEKLKRYISSYAPSEIIVAMGENYRKAIAWPEISIKKSFIIGEIGMMQSQLKNWLHSL